ncbi:glucosylglycerol 3-phosphatase [Pseudomonas sp. Marseille-QA0892]
MRASAQRGGSDRGFLTVVQQPGEAFKTGNASWLTSMVLAEVCRPGVDADHRRSCRADASLAPWAALDGIPSWKRWRRVGPAVRRASH